jgi:hypothetical protein
VAVLKVLKNKEINVISGQAQTNSGQIPKHIK